MNSPQELSSAQRVTLRLAARCSQLEAVIAAAVRDSDPVSSSELLAAASTGLSVDTSRVHGNPGEWLNEQSTAIEQDLESALTGEPR